MRRSRTERATHPDTALAPLPSTVPLRAQETLTRDAHGRLLAVTGSGSFLRTTLPGPGHLKGTVQRIVPSPALDFQVQRLIVNKSGFYAVAAGTNSNGTTKLVVLKIPQQVSRPGEHDELEMTHEVLAVDQFISCSLVQMMWHPLSDDHVVLLSSDGRLSLFDVAADPQYPEQEYILSELRGMHRAPAGMAFPVADGWGHFSILVLATDGNLYAISPIAPIQGRCPAGVVHKLLQIRTSAPESLAWLHGTFKLPSGSGQGTVSVVVADSYVPEGKCPMLRFLGNACAGDAGAPSAQALAVAGDALLSENTNLLAVATAGGDVRVQLLLWDLQPVWALGDPAVMRSSNARGEYEAARYHVDAYAEPDEFQGGSQDQDSDAAPALVTMDTIHLDAPASGRGGAAPPILIWTDTQPSMLVCAYADHICSVRLPWLAGVANMLRESPESIPANGGNWELPLVDLLSEEWFEKRVSMRGVVVHSRPMKGSQVVILSGDSTCDTIPLPAAAPSGSASLFTPADDFYSDARSNGSGLEAEAEAEAEEDSDGGMETLRAPPGPWQGPSKVHLAAQTPQGAGQEKMAAGVKLLEACNGLRDHHIEYAHHVHEELHQQAEQLQRQLQRQRVQAASLASAIEGEQGIKQQSAYLMDRIQRTQQVHINLCKRMELLADIERARPRTMNAAETSFYNELKAQLNGLKGVRSQVLDLQARTEHLLRGAPLKPAFRIAKKIPAEQMGHIEEALMNNMTIMSSNKGKLEELAAGMQALSEDIDDWQIVDK